MHDTPLKTEAIPRHYSMDIEPGVPLLALYRVSLTPKLSHHSNARGHPRRGRAQRFGPQKLNGTADFATGC